MCLFGTRKNQNETRGVFIRVSVHLFEEILSDYLKISSRLESDPQKVV